jgi:hypothetical protein
MTVLVIMDCFIAAFQANQGQLFFTASHLSGSVPCPYQDGGTGWDVY